MKKIAEAPIAFEISKRMFDKIWHKVFAKNHTPYAYEERDMFWEKLISEGENIKG